jgi:purine nucleosidase
MDRPLIRAPLFAPETHGRRGLGNADLPISTAQPLDEHAADLIIREVLAAPGEVTLVAVAPLGNVALALRKAPQIATMLRELIIMGGAFRVDGNVTPLAEFNVYFDPHAAQIVLHSGAPITIMPWDITRDVLMSRADVAELQAIGGPLPAFVADAAGFYIDFHEEHFGYAGCSINDPAALALAFQPDLAAYQHVFVDVELCSETTMGKTVADFMQQTGREPNVRLVTGFNNERFHDLFMGRLATLARDINA